MAAARTAYKAKNPGAPAVDVGTRYLEGQQVMAMHVVMHDGFCLRLLTCGFHRFVLGGLWRLFLVQDGQDPDRPACWWICARSSGDPGNDVLSVSHHIGLKCTPIRPAFVWACRSLLRSMKRPPQTLWPRL